MGVLFKGELEQSSINLKKAWQFTETPRLPAHYGEVLSATNATTKKQ